MQCHVNPRDVTTNKKTREVNHTLLEWIKIKLLYLNVCFAIVQKQEELDGRGGWVQYERLQYRMHCIGFTELGRARQTDLIRCSEGQKFRPLFEVRCIC